ncbi:hypothetical protein vseg_015123 [Gypsophila vaccaria]
MSSSSGILDNSAAISQDDPLYLHSSDHPGLKLVAHPFEGTNFANWKRSMYIALSAKNKVCLIDGTLLKPSASSSSFKNWQRCNDMVFSWILNALSSEIADSILYSDSAKSAWSELEERYGQSNGAQLYGVQQKLNDFSQGNDSIATYFTKLKAIWDEIDAMGMNPSCSCNCTCGASEKQIKFQEDQRVVQFLMGLNDGYSVIRGTILIQNPLPKMSTVYNNLIQEERQREIHHSVQFQVDSASLYAKNVRHVQQNANYQQANANYNKQYSSQQHVSSGYNQGNAHNYRGKVYMNRAPDMKVGVVCNYCKAPGHTIDKCYKLQNRNRKMAGNAFTGDQGGILGAFNDSQKGTIESERINPNVYEQMMNLLKQSQSSGSTLPGAANFAGLFNEDASCPW